MRSKARHGALFGRRSQGLRGVGSGGGDHCQRLDFVQRANPAVIKIGQGKLAAGPVRNALRILFPIRFGCAEIELLFIFESAQGIEIGVPRLRLDQLTQRGTCFGRRAAEEHRSAGQRHGAEQRRLNRRPGFDISDPHGQCAPGRDHPSGQRDEDGDSADAQPAASRQITEALQFAPPGSRCCGQCLLRSRSVCSFPARSVLG